MSWVDNNNLQSRIFSFRFFNALINNWMTPGGIGTGILVDTMLASAGRGIKMPRPDAYADLAMSRQHMAPPSHPSPVWANAQTHLGQVPTVYPIANPPAVPLPVPYGSCFQEF